MREIKFRAWHKPTQLMDDVVLIDFYNEKIGILYADPVMQCESIQKYNFNEVELMQSTGLFDKNGVEIYEGDVIQEFAGEHAQGVWQYSNVSVVEDLRWIPESLGFADCTYIIGNIHDNSELIEEKGNKKEGLANWGIEKTSSLKVKPTQKI